jgi:hypothetical protein
VAAIRPRLQIELHRTDHALVREGDQQQAPAGAQRFHHARPIGQSLGPLERQQKAQRGAACDRILEQQGEFVPQPLGRRRIERADDGQAGAAVQVGRPSSG